MTIEFDIAAFRTMYPEFASETAYPDVMLNMCWDMATCHISDSTYGCISEKCRTSALYLMTAHSCKLQGLLNSGKTGKTFTSSTVDKISVTVAAPNNRNDYDWWLNQTGYGQQYNALLKANSAGGLYVGGSPERSAFRRVGGRF